MAVSAGHRAGRQYRLNTGRSQLDRHAHGRLKPRALGHRQAGPQLDGGLLGGVERDHLQLSTTIDESDQPSHSRPSAPIKKDDLGSSWNPRHLE